MTLSRQSMPADRADAILATVAEAVGKWGKQADVPFSIETIYQAISVARAQPADVPSKQELTKLRRQLAACQNREKRAKQAK